MMTIAAAAIITAFAWILLTSLTGSPSLLLVSAFHLKSTPSLQVQSRPASSTRNPTRPTHVFSSTSSSSSNSNSESTTPSSFPLPFELESSDLTYQLGLSLYQTYYNTCHGKNSNNQDSLLESSESESEITESNDFNTNNLQQAAELFQKTVDLEKATILAMDSTTNDFKNGCDCGNLLVALRSLAAVYASLEDYARCLTAIDEIRYWKARKMPFRVEAEEYDNDNDTYDGLPQVPATTSLKWIYPPSTVGSSDATARTGNDMAVALQTMGEPLLDTTNRKAVQDGAQAYRDDLSKSNQPQSSSTRFTMQYAGNSDLHLADLVAHQPTIGPIFDQLLQTKLYPLVREAFLSSSTTRSTSASTSTMETLPLCVYDALIVRYDGDAATQQGRDRGASLPLHRDGGLFTVNIELEAADDAAGGTLFDNLLVLDEVTIGRDAAVVRPVGPGHAVVHRSTERHAGAPTKRGIRELLVVFLTLRPRDTSICVRDDPTPSLPLEPQHENHFDLQGVERAFYMQNLVQQPQLSLLPNVQDRCYEWAVQNSAMYGEALFWVGYQLVQSAKQELGQLRNLEENTTTRNDDSAVILKLWNDMNSGIAALETVAQQLDPCCIRSLAFLASAYSMRWAFAVDADPQQQFGLCEKDEQEKAKVMLQRANALDGFFDGMLGVDNAGATSSRVNLSLQLAELMLL